MYLPELSVYSDFLELDWFKCYNYGSNLKVYSYEMNDKLT